MRIQRWYFRVGRSCGLRFFLNGIRYPRVLVCVDRGVLWMGVGVTYEIGPYALWVMHLSYVARGFEE